MQYADRPLGILTFKEAERYFEEYLVLMQEGVGMCEKESKLPASYERMKEALMVQVLNWCNSGKGFDESCEFIVQGYIRLSQFCPDELVQMSSREQMRKAMLSGDRELFEASKRASTAAAELAQLRLRQLNADWSTFQTKFRY